LMAEDAAAKVRKLRYGSKGKEARQPATYREGDVDWTLWDTVVVDPHHI
jgi:hypothetical protein